MPKRFKEHATHDPFAITPDPNVYVPRTATETARKDLLRSASNPRKTTALIGPPGLGKTLLLHLLVEEAPEDLQTVYLPYAALPPEELCGWALGLLGLPENGDSIGALQAHSRDLSERGSSLLLLIDDAGAMPVATARWAGELVQNSSGRVRLVIAASDNATGNRTIAAIGTNFDIVHLDDPMTESETSKYIDGRLALARVPDSIRARFDDQTIRLLHRISAGIPRRLHSAAMGILQEAPVAAAGEGAETPTVPVEPPTAPANEPVEPAASEQTLGVPPEERRVLSRRAEPEGVDVRVGLGGAPEQKGRRAEDRVEAAPQPGEPTAEEFDESAPIEDEEVEEEVIPDWEPPIAPPVARRALPASRGAIVLGTLIVAFAAVAIPVIRSALSEPHQIAGPDLQRNLRESRPGALDGSMRENPREPMQGDFEKSSEAVDPVDSMVRDEIAEIPAMAGTEEPLIVESAVVEPSSAEDMGPFAVQINASPWANVAVDGIDLGATPLANIPLFGGEHSFRVKMPDGRMIDRIIEIDAERRFISFE
ncbi:MAG: AAA family ATPase [Deltaproteobacteria bacterium]|nr:AAA family ATPase [Deltaproteobacteria bacterium]